MQLFIKTLIGPCFAIPCEETDTILELKQKMEKNYEEGMPPDQMRILWGGKQLEDERTIKDYGLMHNTTLHICLRLRGGMQLFIKTLIGPCFAVPCEETDTILELKQKMEKNYEEGMPPDQMRILWGGKQLEDERTIKDYGLMHNTTLHICLRLRGGMQLFIKTLIGPCFAVPCEETDTILELKQKMEKNYEEGMPPDQMRILWGGKQLEDERTIKDYGLMHNTTLHICLRLRGGN
jgi:ubiquitin C